MSSTIATPEAVSLTPQSKAGRKPKVVQTYPSSPTQRPVLYLSHLLAEWQPPYDVQLLHFMRRYFSPHADWSRPYRACNLRTYSHAIAADPSVNADQLYDVMHIVNTFLDQPVSEHELCKAINLSLTSQCDFFIFTEDIYPHFLHDTTYNQMYGIYKDMTRKIEFICDVTESQPTQYTFKNDDDAIKFLAGRHVVVEPAALRKAKFPCAFDPEKGSQTVCE